MFILVIKYPISPSLSLQHKIVTLQLQVATLNSAALPLLGGWAMASASGTSCVHILIFQVQLNSHITFG